MSTSNGQDAVAKDTKTKRRNWIRIVSIGCALLVLGLVAYSYYQRRIRPHVFGPAADRSAHEDLSGLGDALKRLQEELLDLGCTKPIDYVEDHALDLLVGPHYWWGGTDRDSGVLIRTAANGTEIRACALKGSQPTGPATRYIYRINLKGEELPTLLGPCAGRQFGGPEANCYVSSIVNKSDCSSPLFMKSGIRCREVHDELISRAGDYRALARKSLNAFALDLYAKTPKGEKNFVVSPYSLFTVMAMLYAGSGGDTRTEMGRCLRAMSSGLDIHDAMGSFAKELNCCMEQSGGRLEVSNRLLGVAAADLFPDYRRTLAAHYPGVKLAGFSEQSHGLSDYQFTLVNLIHFKSKWESQFSKDSTRPLPFHILGNRTISVPTMFQHFKSVNYAENHDLQVCEFPYLGHKISMMVFLPRKKDGLPDVEKSLTPRFLNRWIGSVSPPQDGVDAYLPRFEIETDLRYNAVLRAMGMREAFAQGRADFSRMIDTKGAGIKPYLEYVSQHAWIKTDEEGTEFKAVSCACVTIGDGFPPKVFRVDRPFLFLIRHNESGAILCIGRVINPLQRE